MKTVKIFFFITLLTLTLPAFYSCSPVAKQYRAEKKRHKKLEKDKIEKQEEAEKAFDEAMKRHYKMQSKETQKAMKHAKREAERYNEHRAKKEFFLKKWFTSKKKKNREATKQ